MNPIVKVGATLALCLLSFQCAPNKTALPTVKAPSSESPAAEKAASQPPSIEEQIDALVREELKNGPVAGIAIAIDQREGPDWEKGYGSIDLEHLVATKADSVFRIGSITKQFTAVAVLQLVEAGKLALDAPVTKYLPAYPMHGKTITLRHLLGHTSGIKNYTNDEDWAKTLVLDKSVAEMVALFKDWPLEFDPGTKFSYSNSGYVLLGAVIEKVTGGTYAAYLNSHVFLPAKLDATTYCSEQNVVRNRAQGYQAWGASFRNDAPLSMTQPYAAGALCSTAIDLVKWRHALTDGSLLKASSLQLMQRPGLLKNGKETGYGFGLMLGTISGHTIISHGGSINGFASQISSYPEDGLTISVLANTEGANVGVLEQKIARLLLHIPVAALQTIDLPAQEAGYYVGSYVLEGLGEMKITLEEGTLKGRLNDQPSLPLLYQGEHTFVPDLSAVGAPMDPELRFVFEVKDGQAQEMTLHQRGMKMAFTRKE